MNYKNLSRFKKLLMIFQFSAIVFMGYCQDVSQKEYSKDSVVNVLGEIRLYIEEVHPNPYHSTTKSYIDSVIGLEAMILPDSLSEKELYELILPIVNSYNDGHIQVKCQFGKYINKAINENKGIFPLTLYQLNDNVYVKLSVFDSIVKPGYQLLSIDYVSIDSIINEYSKYKSGDNLEIRRRKVVEDFTVLDYFTNNGKESYTIGFQKGNSEILYAELPSAKMIDIIEFNKSYSPPKKKKHFSNSLIKMDEFIYFQVHPKRSIALLTLPSFAIDNGIEQEYGNKIDSIFHYLSSQNIDTLLIDIRENQGGRDYSGMCILKYIATSDYSYGQAIMKTSTHQQNLYREILEKELSDSLYLKGKEYYNYFLRKYGDVFSLESNSLQKSKPEDLFKGKVFVLIGEKTYSAAVSFAAVCKCYGFATLIGEETDGQMVSYTSLVPVHLSIPCIQFGVAHRKVVNPCADSSFGGLKPDILINKSNKNHLANIDEIIEFILNGL